MTAAALVTNLTRLGAYLYADGDGVVVEAPKGVLTKDILAELRAAKPAVRAYLKGDWTPTDYRAFFHERAGITEYDNGLPRLEAEVAALDATVAEWLRLNPPTDHPGDGCAACSRDLGEIGRNSVPVQAGPGQAVWLHRSCFAEWRSIRKDQAVRALSGMGISLSISV